MEIYVIQEGDSIESISNKYGISVERLISDNGLINPYALVVGQTLVILYPKSTYTVKQGDTLATIAESNRIPFMQLIRNNPFFFNREHIYPGEILVMEFNTAKDVQVNGYTSPFISQDILMKVLPYMTFISIYNYQIADIDGSRIVTFGDDTNIIRIAKQYSTIPLLMISALSPTGDINIESVYRLLLDIKLQDELINEILQTLRSKEFLGVNLLISFISEYNQGLYLNLLAKISEVLRNNGYIFMITINYDYSVKENIDYHNISLLVDRIIFLENIWLKKNMPPAPVSNISLIKSYIRDVINTVSPNNISLGLPMIGYDWNISNNIRTSANIMSLNSTLTLAYDYRAVIHFDEVSQTPYFEYSRTTFGVVDKHIVWFIDARSINALEEIIIEYDLIGTGIWNVTSYNQQLFSILAANFNIIKLPII